MTRKLTTAAVLAAIGIILPVATHGIGGQGMGQIFLPLHLMALVAGLYLGASYGMIVGIVSVMGSFLIAAMPPAAMLVFFLIQVGAMGLFAGVFRRVSYGAPWRIYVALLCAQFLSWGLLTQLGILGAHVFVFSAVFGMICKGIVGIVIQWVVVPPIVMFLRRRSHE